MQAAVSTEVAAQLSTLSMKAHYRTKLRARHQLLKGLKRAIFLDQGDFILKGISSVFNKLLQR
ncbi:MAG: hypothetical protein GQ582_05195 [Methyloprofundus sp.]|nr:hypothetical protein [Methyloprofundus sp.]